MCQIGAREHYSITRALIKDGLEVRLLTDYWANHFGLALGNLSQRHHPSIDKKLVKSWNLSCLLFEAKCRLAGNKNWDLMLKRNQWFGEKVSLCLPDVFSDHDKKPIVMAYSYAARQVFINAKKRGFSTVLAQIDPGPFEMRLVRDLYQKAKLPFIAPPEHYWDSWRMECELADKIVVNSTWSKNALEQEGVDTGKIVIIPLVYEQQGDTREHLDFLKTKKTENFSADNPLEILFLGQVNVRKGILELMDAIQMLAAKHIHWTIVGPQDSILRSKLDSLPNTTVVGAVSRNESLAYYKEADIFILPTHSDGFALTQLEAMSFGLPVIASKNCGEVVEDRLNGALLDSVTPDAIVEAVGYFYDSPINLAKCREVVCDQPVRKIEQLASDLAGLASAVSTKSQGY